MILLVLASVLAAAGADCDACVDGRCYSRTTLARGLYVPDQMAIDRKNGILYVHSDSTTNTTFYHEDLTIQLIQKQGFVGLAVDQDTQVLYTAKGTKFFKYLKDCNYATEIAFPNVTNLVKEIHSLFYKDCLTYTEATGLYLITDTLRYYSPLVNYTISDLVVQRGCNNAKLYFVAGDTVYHYIRDTSTLTVVSQNKYVLSIDKYDNVYFGDASANVIYKMDETTNKLVPFAAYEAGSVDKFVFDDNNNIVSYDSADGSFSHWKSASNDGDANCTIKLKYCIINRTLNQF